MGMEDMGREAIRILAASGLSNDVIELLKEKVNLLTAEITRLEAENERLRSRGQDSNENPVPVPPLGNLTADTVKVLRLLFQQRLTASQIARSLNLPKGIVDYHLGLLLKHQLVKLPAFRTVGAEPAYWLTQKGRACIIENELATSRNPDIE
ncbi:MAG TPA: winged helix-turn-helix domain-containing protein [Chthoniobacterales bacterium]|jgi:DNA-binding transcriptional ArsR family regulator